MDVPAKMCSEAVSDELFSSSPSTDSEHLDIPLRACALMCIYAASVMHSPSHAGTTRSRLCGRGLCLTASYTLSHTRAAPLSETHDASPSPGSDPLQYFPCVFFAPDVRMMSASASSHPPALPSSRPPTVL